MARAAAAGSATPKTARGRRAAAQPPAPASPAEPASDPTPAISALLSTASQLAAPTLEPSYRDGPGYRAPSFAGPMPIGEEDRNIFNCPVCSRPLATGVRRCPNCRTRLVLGVPARRAGVFVSVGVLVGMLTGGGAMAAVAGPAAGRPSPSQAPVVDPGPSVAPSPSSTAPVSPSAAPVVAGIPPAARAALAQIGDIHAGFVDDVGSLAAELTGATFDTSAVAQTLRSMNSQAAFGVDVAARLGGWDDAARLAGDLDAFYREIRTIARTGLAASVRNEAAYRDAATQMVAALAALEALDADARLLARAAGVDLPPLELGASSAP